MNTIANEDYARRAIKVWMREVMQSKGWSANEWATKSGTSATNITRFLSPTSDIMPSGSTIAKLSRTAGSQPKLNLYAEVRAANACYVPCVHAVTASGFPPVQFWEWIMDEGNGSKDRAVVEGPITGPAFVCDIPDAGMVGRGLLMGDRILVEQVKVKDLISGHLVLAHHEGRAKVMEWQAPLALFRPSPERVTDQDFKPVRVSDIEVYGRVTRLLRDL